MSRPLEKRSFRRTGHTPHSITWGVTYVSPPLRKPYATCNYVSQPLRLDEEKATFRAAFLGGSLNPLQLNLKIKRSYLGRLKKQCYIRLPDKCYQHLSRTLEDGLRASAFAQMHHIPQAPSKASHASVSTVRGPVGSGHDGHVLKPHRAR